MKVRELMTSPAHACQYDADLSYAAQLMNEKDCGCLPVVDENDRVVGIMTDRDACMAACVSGRALQDLRVQDAMSKDVVACNPEDLAERALQLMSKHQIRRIPVVDDHQYLQGMVSLSDLARSAFRETNEKVRRTQALEVAHALTAIVEPVRSA